MRSLLLHLILAALLAGTARSASIYVEQFNSGDAGWISRDPLEMTVSFTNAFGNGPGSLAGYFENQLVPSSETDAFRANSGSSAGNFAGNYWAIAGGFSAWNFSLYADDVLPADLQVRFSDGTNTFFRILSGQLSAIDSWTTINVPLNSYAGWFGAGATAFSNALSSVQFVDVQISRNGTGAQTYFLDNFSLLGNTAAVPEPGSALLLMIGAGMLRLLRGKIARRKKSARNIAASISLPSVPAAVPAAAGVAAVAREQFDLPRSGRRSRRRPSDTY